MTDHIEVKMEKVDSSENDPSAAGRLRIQNAPMRVKLRNVRLRKPNWTPKESLDLLDEFEKHKMILNSRGNTGVSTKAKRKIAWTRIANRINSKGYSAVKRTVYECKRRWKNMVTFAKLSTLEYVKSIKLGGDPAKTVTDMERRITDVHGDTKLLRTLELAENKDLDALSDLVEVEPIPTDRPSSTTHIEGNIGFSPTSILGNYGLQQQALGRRQGLRSPRKSFYDSMVTLDNDDEDRSPSEASLHTIEEHTPSIESYYSIPPEHFNRSANEASETQFGVDQVNGVDDTRFTRDGTVDHSADPQESFFGRKKLKLEVEKLQLEKDVLEMQKVKLRLETKAWRRFLSQRSTPPPPQQQTPAPFTMAPFYWPSPSPGFPPFYGAAPAMGNVGMPQIPVHAPSSSIKKD